MAETNGKALRERGYRFTAVRLSNWKNFLSVDQRLQSRGFLVGPNASGKSNFLDAFRFLREIATVGGGFQSAVRNRKGVTGIRCLAARRDREVSVDVSIGTDEQPEAWRYAIRFSQGNKRIPLIVSERVWCAGDEVLCRPQREDREDSERLTQTFLEQVNANRDFREVHEFLGAIRYLHVIPQLVREPERSLGRSNDPYGGDFVEQVATTPTKTRQSHLRRIRDALRSALPQLAEIGLTLDDRGIPHLRARYEHWRPRGAWHSEEEFSDGTLRLMGVLWALLDGWGPLLLEEPELSLHPDVVRVLPQLFARVQRKTARQVLVTSHSPDLLRDPGIGLDEVFLMIPSAEGTEVRAASGIAEVADLLRNGLPLPDAVLPHVRPKDVQQLMMFGE